MITANRNLHRTTVIVIGNGMVGHRFCDRLVEADVERKYRIIAFGEEPRPAYDRVHLTEYFTHRDTKQLALADTDWYQDRDVVLHIDDRIAAIDRERRVVVSACGRETPYDIIVLATGSAPFVPQIPGIDKPGVHVYRTIEDLEGIISDSRQAKRAIVLGGGLLGLEAAKAAVDLGLETLVVEAAPRLMPRQLDDAGSAALVRKIEQLGVRVYAARATQEVIGEDRFAGLRFNDGEELAADMLIVSAGIRPRDELARQCGIEVGPRGGVSVNHVLETSDPDIFAIGEVALHEGMIYGLVGPGYEMADILVENLVKNCPETERKFSGADMSTKLKLLGCDVASFGQNMAAGPDVTPVTYEDPFGGVYRKLLFTNDGSKLLGGILVGDASDYSRLLALSKSGQPLKAMPGDLVRGASGTTAGAGGDSDLPDDAQVCSCNNVCKGTIRQAVADGKALTLPQLKVCTKAGTGCGGCMPLVTQILTAELKASGKKVSNDLCEHFAYSRQELFQIVKIKSIRTFNDLLESHGHGNGCEICRPAVASILASLWNANILDHVALQDTNDRFLANIQRGGLYSVVPRVPGGEITPEKLIVLGEVAKKYGLATKITGGQRVDLFGAPVHQLPDIWEELVNAGFESGHAYGKALRTVKSCVGTTWCRYGVGDAVGMAIRVEMRYRGIRAPHKLKSAVSGCVRECAEAQSKDFGMIATEKGWNLYVCGNGGATPRHADLLAADLDEDTCIRYIDRFVMYYIQTADKLTRTARWVEQMDGGIEYLRDVVVNDKLNIGEELERQLQYLVDTYRCEWAEVVNDPARRMLFAQFANTEETVSTVEYIEERGQRRPQDWPKTFIPLESLSTTLANEVEPIESPDEFEKIPAFGEAESETPWVSVGLAADFPRDAGVCIKHGNRQIALFNFATRGAWYACQNMCPHKREFVLSRGLLGDQAGIPKVACPLHKKTFSLESGDCLTGEELPIEVYPVKIVDDEVFVQLPPSSGERHVLDICATDSCATESCAPCAG